MAQHDMNIANQGFPATRADINNALQAIATNNSGTSAPSTTFANQWFYNETSNKLFIRNEANNAFIEVATLDQTANEWQITTGQISASDSDGLVFKTDDGNTRITLSDGGDVTFAAGTDIITASAGSDNIRIGEGAGDSIASGGDNNVAIGKDAGTNITTGTNNVTIGISAGDAITNGNTNIAIGSNALGTNQQGDRNVAVGTGALQNANPSGDVDSYNVAIGYHAGVNIQTGIQNVIVGGAAGDAITTGNQNTLVGHNCGGATTGTFNAFYGRSSGSAVTSGTKNSIIGSYNGNQNNLDIRTSDNNIVLSDGDGNPRGHYRSDYGGWAWQSSVEIAARHSSAGFATVANGGIVQITSGEVGAAHVCVYDTGSGDGGIFFASYRSGTVLNNSAGAFSFNTTQGLSGYNVYKSGFSHAMFFENRTGISRGLTIAIYAARAR